MKKYIAIAALLAAGTAFANAGVEDWNDWTLLKESSEENEALFVEGTSLSTLKSTGDFAIRADFTDFDYTAGTTAGSYFIGLRWSEGDHGTYCGIRISEDGNRDAKLFVYGKTKESVSMEMVDLDSLSGNLTVSIEYVSVQQTAYVYMGNALLGTTKFDFDWTADKGFNIGAGGPPEDYEANKLYKSCTYDSVKLSYSVSQIPEPSTFGLLAGLGALALVGTRRRRR